MAMRKRYLSQNLRASDVLNAFITALEGALAALRSVDNRKGWVSIESDDYSPPPRLDPSAAGTIIMAHCTEERDGNDDDGGEDEGHPEG